MIGIIAAMDLEVEAFLSLANEVESLSIDSVIYHRGKMANQEFVLTKSGVGKVACSYHVTKLIDSFHPSLLVNVGVAGSLRKEIRPLDIVIGNRVCQHDVFVPGWPIGFNQEKTCVSTKNYLLDIAKKVQVPFAVFFGNIASGDTFVQKNDAFRILKDYPEAICAEMEAGAMAEVARLAGVDFVVLRAISDVAIEENNECQFDEIASVAAQRSAEFTYRFLEVYQS